MDQILLGDFCFKLDKYDANKQSESEVSQIQFFFWLIVYIIYKAAFYNKPHLNWAIDSKGMGGWRVASRSSICILLFNASLARAEALKALSAL